MIQGGGGWTGRRGGAMGRGPGEGETGWGDGRD